MTNRTDAQAGLDAQSALDGATDTITPSGQVTTTLQPLLDGALMQDEVPVTSVNTKTGDVVVDGTEIELIATGGVSVTQAISDLDAEKAEQSDLDLTNGQVLTNTTNITTLDDNKTETVNGKTGKVLEIYGTDIETSTGSGVSVTGALNDLTNELDSKLASVVGGTDITIDNTDPANPIINYAASDPLDYVLVGDNVSLLVNDAGYATAENTMSSAWENPFDDYTVQPTDNRIDGFPDLGTPSDAVYTMLTPASYPATWSCNIYNDSAAGYQIQINDDGGAKIYDLTEGAGCNVRVNDTNDGFIFVAIKGTAPIVLGVEYADFDNFNIWQDRKFASAVIPDATASDINGFAPDFIPDAGAGIFYTFDIDMRNEPDTTGFKIDVWVTSNQDSTNTSIGRLYSRFGPTMATSTGNPWSVPALLSDATTPLLTSQQLYADQFPVDTATPMLIKFATGAVPTSGNAEILADGGTFNFGLGRFTIDSTASFGRTSGASEAELALYAVINLTTDPSVAVDSDYVSFGRIFPNVLDDQKILITSQYSAKYFEITSLPTSIRYYLRRMPSGANDGGLFYRDYTAYNHFGGAYAGGGGASAGVSFFEHGA